MGKHRITELWDRITPWDTRHELKQWNRMQQRNILRVQSDRNSAYAQIDAYRLAANRAADKASAERARLIQVCLQWESVLKNSVYLAVDSLGENCLVAPEYEWQAFDHAIHQTTKE